MKETNELIAEFMGAIGTPKYNPTEWDIYITGCLDVDSDDENAKHFYTPEEMKYHTSWDWLMPVVEKIKDMGYDQQLDNIDNVLTCDLRKENLYNAVVEFIKFYNQNK
jgi:hypothetical protein